MFVTSNLLVFELGARIQDGQTDGQSDKVGNGAYWASRIVNVCNNYSRYMADVSSFVL